ncbi:hypothetical protein B9Z55_013930 [Caenorhabditis nigoni]|uniref:C2H2-type domain-containing protein n=1 Tax=Caenorhabditis nigoni TaxID=1611254 RepID=A0A2G5U3U2_9PELO|nr:hypothetical protein B9Z55_013930 [Caenorhabditis nigoni]
MPRHKCKDCGKSFDLKRYLTKHELRMHNDPNKSEETQRSTEPLKCSMCEKVFPRLSHLQRHQMTHLNVRNYTCDFCDEKFVQKAHLTRHLSRKHANEEGVEVEWIACNKCGKLFKTTYEMKFHRRNVHELHRCKRCQEVIEGGNDSLRQHHIRCRSKQKMCDHCGASFTRPADLVAHQTACLKKVALICVPCETFFKQRVELDRHVKKLHYRSAKCKNCDHTSQSPVEHSRHALECLKIKICGYCDLENPSDDHVSEFHWRRLKRTIPRRVAEKLMKTKHKDIPSTSDEKPVEDGNLEVEDIDDSETGLNLFEQPTLKDQRTNKIEGENSLFDFSEPSTSQLDFNSTMFDEEDDSPEDYLSFSICPKDTDVPFHLRGRLPPELVSLFPELEDTSIVLLNATPLPMCRMTIRVPVSIPQSCDNEQKMRAWQKSIIKLEDDEPTNLI